MFDATPPFKLTDFYKQYTYVQSWPVDYTPSVPMIDFNPPIKFSYFSGAYRNEITYDTVPPQFDTGRVLSCRSDAAWDGAQQVESFDWSVSFGHSGSILVGHELDNEYQTAYDPANAQAWIDRGGTNLWNVPGLQLGADIPLTDTYNDYNSIDYPGILLDGTETFKARTYAEAYDEDYTTTKLRIMVATMSFAVPR